MKSDLNYLPLWIATGRQGKNVVAKFRIGAPDFRSAIKLMEARAAELDFEKKTIWKLLRCREEVIISD